MKSKFQLAGLAMTGALLLAVIAGCGGGGGGEAPPPPPPPTLVITTTGLPDGVVGTAYSQTVAATGGTGARTFSVSAGSLGPDLMLNATTGAITGTPMTAGMLSFTIMVTDSGTPQQTDTQALTIDINDPLVITTMALPGATIGMLYNGVAAGFQVVATGGTPGTHTFSVSSGSLPAGLTMNAAGMISGTPTAGATNQTFTVRVADGSNPQQVDTQVLTIVVTLEITTTVLPDATAGTAYNQTLAAQGGLPPYVNWSRIAGSMPPGIADPVAATGVISGTPGAVCMATTSNFTAQVSDSAATPASDTQALSITVNPGPALNITTTSLPNGTVGVAYSSTVQATGGVPPYSFAVTMGMLPSMLNLAMATGAITGTPDTMETQAFNITVTDSCGTMDTQALSITIGNVSLGRNDSIATATALSNGTSAASISPSGDPNTIRDPDEDFYAITAAAGATVTITVLGPGLNPPSPLDPVIEIQDVNGTRLSTCRDPADNAPPSPINVDPTPNAFDDACINDDISLGVNRDSMLEFQNTTGGVLTFYVRVVDFRGDARPDLLYTITISGAN